jgi:polyketide cyclase/dehydrase/lipid transport protein
MADKYTRQGLIEAPIDDVWSIVSDPHTHPDWWPEVKHVRFPDETEEEGEYIRKVRRFGFLDLVDNIWVAEPMEDLKQVNFRCTLTGTYTRFALTPAQDNTFIELESGVNPIGVQGRMIRIMGPLFFKRWQDELLEELPKVVESMREKQAS